MNVNLSKIYCIVIQSFKRVLLISLRVYWAVDFCLGISIK
jgi:hypothetical protein